MVLHGNTRFNGMQDVKNYMNTDAKQNQGDTDWISGASRLVM